MQTILVTGASGFLGRAICRRLSKKNQIIGFDQNKSPAGIEFKAFVLGDITCQTYILSVCRQYKPDVVINAAGIAHQKLNSDMSCDDYEKMNNLAAKNFALAVAEVNPDVYCIFFSSISVYGEKHCLKAVKESENCQPTSRYAVSKLNMEKNLTLLFEKSQIKKLDILRLAPVYDVFQTLNLDKRVFLPKKLFYIRFGSGSQKMSVLSRENLVDFIDYRLNNNQVEKFFNIFNVCDQNPCTFNDLIEVFKLSRYQPDRFIVTIPLKMVRAVACLLKGLIKNKTVLINSFYDKIANDLVFDGSKMLESGFKPKQTLRSVFIEKQW